MAEAGGRKHETSRGIAEREVEIGGGQHIAVLACQSELLARELRMGERCRLSE